MTFPDLTDSLSLTCFSNHGDSTQMLVLPLPEGTFLVVTSRASHGYADFPATQVQADLRAVVKLLEDEIATALNSRDPEVKVTGGGRFAPQVAQLQSRIPSY